jgi:hypothetical protein
MPTRRADRGVMDVIPSGRPTTNSDDYPLTDLPAEAVMNSVWCRHMSVESKYCRRGIGHGDA